MSRQKNAHWGFNVKALSYEEVCAQLLMDVRDELQTLNMVASQTRDALQHYGGIQKELRGLRRDLKKVIGGGRRPRATRKGAQ